MRKAVLVCGVIILLVSAILLTGGLYEKYFSVPLTVEYGNKTLFTADCPVTLWRYGMKQRAGSFCALYQKTIAEGRTPVQALNFISEGLGDRMEKLAESLKCEPKDAELVILAQKPYFKYISDTSGMVVDMEKTGIAIACALDKGTAQVVTKSITASITEDMLVARTLKRGGYSTDFSTSCAERQANIRLALSAINGTAIAPNESFSFNIVVGPRTEERGYKTAKIISNGEFVAGVGGGVCQVSTTVYNAALLAGLEIITAARHSLPISYVPPSRDAMVTASTDFVFKNNSAHTIYIFTDGSANTAKVEIFGVKQTHKTTLESVIKQHIPFKNKALTGEYLSESELIDYERIRAGKNGLISELYMFTEGRRLKLRSDTYAPQDALWQKVEPSALGLLHKCARSVA